MKDETKAKAGIFVTVCVVICIVLGILGGTGVIPNPFHGAAPPEAVPPTDSGAAVSGGQCTIDTDCDEGTCQNGVCVTTPTPPPTEPVPSVDTLGDNYEQVDYFTSELKLNERPMTQQCDSSDCLYPTLSHAENDCDQIKECVGIIQKPDGEIQLLDRLDTKSTTEQDSGLYFRKDAQGAGYNKNTGKFGTLPITSCPEGKYGAYQVKGNTPWGANKMCQLPIRVAQEYCAEHPSCMGYTTYKGPSGNSGSAYPIKGYNMSDNGSWDTYLKEDRDPSNYDVHKNHMGGNPITCAGHEHQIKGYTPWGTDKMCRLPVSYAKQYCQSNDKCTGFMTYAKQAGSAYPFSGTKVNPASGDWTSYVRK